MALLEGLRLHRIDFGVDAPGPLVHGDGSVSWTLRPLDLPVGLVVVSRPGGRVVAVHGTWAEAWWWVRRRFSESRGLERLHMTTYGARGGESGQPYVMRRWVAARGPGRNPLLSVADAKGGGA
jgi:hypothetical protein